ncbi:MAG: WD40 repeat domain-containing protein, partial [Bacteroidota bacterium]
MRQLSSAVFFALITTCFVPAQEMGLKESKEFSNLGDYVKQAGFSPYRNFFAFTIGDNTLRVYDRDWEQVFGHQGNPKALGGVFAFSPDEKQMAYGRYKGFNDIAIIRLADMKVTQVLSRHTNYINHLEFSNDGNLLVSTSTDKQAIIWEMKQEKFTPVNTFDEFESTLYESSFSSDDRFLVTGDARGHVLVLERTNRGYERFQKFQYRKYGVHSVTFRPGSYEFVTGSRYGLRRYRLVNEEFVLTDSVKKGAAVEFPVHFSPDGQFLAIGNHHTAVIFNVGEDSIHPIDFVYRHMDNVFGATFSDDGRFFVTFGNDQQVIIWEIDHVKPSDRSMVVSWLKGDLSLAQRRALDPSTVLGILAAADSDLTLPMDEFETSSEYSARQERLADRTLAMLQQEMEKQYGARSRSGGVEIPLQALIRYNADLKIYKIRFMETEAGVEIPVAEAKKLKTKWKEA